VIPIQQVRYAYSNGTNWATETVVGSGRVAYYTSIALACNDCPRITFVDIDLQRLFYAQPNGFFWTTELVDSNASSYNSLKVDPDGNPRISYYDVLHRKLKYADAAIQLLSPKGGELWPAGSTQFARWRGLGTAQVFLSQDGGVTYTAVTGAPDTSHVLSFQVPNWTTGLGKLKIVRDSPRSTAVSPGFIEIAPGLVSPWWTKVIDAAGLTGYTPSLRLARGRIPHITYWDATAHAVRYAVRAGSVWNLETVYAAGGSHTQVPLALGPGDRPCIAYFDNLRRQLRYGERLPSGWSSEVIGSLTTTAEYASLALDAAGQPSVSFYDPGFPRLALATRAAGSWTIEGIDPGPNVGLYNCLALDAAGAPSVSYYDGTQRDLRFAWKAGGVWNRESVDTTGDVGSYTSLALDTSGDPHVSYVNATLSELRCAVKSGGTWTIERVPGTTGASGPTSIALDPAGITHVLFYDGTAGRLRHAIRSSGGNWSVETIEAAVGGGREQSLAIDADGAPHLACLDAIAADLRYGSAVVDLTEPSGGDVWPVGAPRRVTWEGVGAVTLFLSTDGGASYGPLASGVTGGIYALAVPDLPSETCRMRLVRSNPPWTSETDSTFSIRSTILLRSFTAVQVPFESGAVVRWDTDPGPADLAGYRLEKAVGTGPFVTLLALTGATEYRDPNAGPGSRYRLTAVNGLHVESVLGEADYQARKPLTAGPLPSHGAPVSILFAVAPGPGGSAGSAQVELFDSRGRLVRVLARGAYGSGFQGVQWDGRDERGEPVSSGVYYLRSVSGGHATKMKITLVR